MEKQIIENKVAASLSESILRNAVIGAKKQAETVCPYLDLDALDDMLMDTLYPLVSVIANDIENACNNFLAHTYNAD